MESLKHKNPVASFLVFAPKDLVAWSEPPETMHRIAKLMDEFVVAMDKYVQEQGIEASYSGFEAVCAILAGASSFLASMPSPIATRAMTVASHIAKARMDSGAVTTTEILPDKNVA